MDYPFLALVGIAGTSFTLALSGALMPGPLFTVTVAEAAKRGVWAGPMIITGHVVLELVLVTAVITGLGTYLKAPSVIGIISLVGGIILLAMGGDMIRKSSSLTLEQEPSETVSGLSGNPVILGFVSSLANPYWILWWVTIGLGYLTTASHFGLAGLTAFFLGHITADYGWYILVALGISRGRRIGSDRGYQMLIRGCGLFLVCFGGWFLNEAYGYFVIM